VENKIVAIKTFEEIEAWQQARDLVRVVREFACSFQEGHQV